MAVSVHSTSASSSQRAASWFAPHVFAAIVVLLLVRYDWAQPWLLSGAAPLTYSILAGGRNRILPAIPLWTLLSSINIAYSIAATSWLLLWCFAAACYPAIFLSCVFQFALVSSILKRFMRRLLKELHFTADKIAFFNLPALEIDRDVDGLMVIRGLTFSLSTLTIWAHGVEVGIKFSDDMEMALVVDLVTIKLFRRIDIGDVYGNIKGWAPEGGEHEMEFHKFASNTKDANGDALMDADIFNADSPMLSAARTSTNLSQKEKIKMSEEMTANAAPKNLCSPEEVIKNVRLMSAADGEAEKKYSNTLEEIESTSIIHESRQNVKNYLEQSNSSAIDEDDRKGMRAAICAELHSKLTIPHPPGYSIKVTTLQTLPPPWLRRFLHRLPLLLRVLLNTVSHFHPVFIESITVGGSGAWMETMIKQKIFKQYANDHHDIAHLQKRISAWLNQANFCVQLLDINGVAQVPVDTSFDIITSLRFNDILLYRTVPKQIVLKEVIRLGGADATITLPAFLMPHHEHLLPPVPTAKDTQQKRRQANEADGKPKEIQAQHDVEQTIKDETNATISTHVRLPACFDQELLDFISALVKATKIVEIERDADELLEGGVHGFKDFAKETKEKIKHGLQKVTVDAMANDRWIAKLVGKITKKLETAEGDVGYSGNLPVALKMYRDQAESASKLLP